MVCCTWQSASGCDPIVIGSETQSKPFVGHSKIAVATNSNRVGPYGSDFLRNYPDIGPLTAVVREAIVTETVVEIAQQHDIVFQHDIRAAPTAATRTAPETSTTARAPAAPDCRSTVSAAAREPRPAAMTHARSRPEISASGSCTVARSLTPGSRCPVYGLAVNQVNGQDFSCMVEIAPERS